MRLERSTTVVARRMMASTASLPRCGFILRKSPSHALESMTLKRNWDVTPSTAPHRRRSTNLSRSMRPLKASLRSSLSAVRNRWSQNALSSPASTWLAAAASSGMAAETILWSAAFCSFKAPSTLATAPVMPSSSPCGTSLPSKRRSSAEGGRRRSAGITAELAVLDHSTLSSTSRCQYTRATGVLVASCSPRSKGTLDDTGASPSSSLVKYWSSLAHAASSGRLPRLSRSFCVVDTSSALDLEVWGDASALQSRSFCFSAGVSRALSFSVYCETNSPPPFTTATLCLSRPPPLTKWTVGKLSTSNQRATSSSMSQSTLTKVATGMSMARRVKTGASCLHGPHQSAKKSTMSRPSSLAHLSAMRSQCATSRTWMGRRPRVSSLSRR
mmetsp:Transcript_3696/g.12923  ORF Transcript_3696/g.12923 Transcript_3696/m.12923 type:complete len:386 (-) Transcript_3696:484-1641(-)